jgi:hypothetical protein
MGDESPALQGFYELPAPLGQSRGQIQFRRGQARRPRQPLGQRPLGAKGRLEGQGAFALGPEKKGAGIENLGCS